MKNMFKKLLVVDDIEEYVKVLEILLWDKYGVIPAHNLKEAQEKFLKYNPDGAIIDIRLNDKDETNMEGEILLEWIMKQKRDFPVIMMSAYTTPDIAIRMLRKGARHYFSKPFQIEEFLNILKREIG